MKDAPDKGARSCFVDSKASVFLRKRSLLLGMLCLCIVGVYLSFGRESLGTRLDEGPQAQNNPCPINPYTNVQWIYDPVKENCTYPKIIVGRGATGQQTDIVMSVAKANEYAKSVGNPRSLFLDPAKFLNNRSLTNMSDEALAALVYAQVFVEEKWFKDYNWVHPYSNSNNDPEGGAWPSATSLNAKRYAPASLGALNEWANFLTKASRPYRLGGLGFGPANQLMGQVLDSAQWYVEYSNLPDNRYGLPARPFPLEQDSALAVLAKAMRMRDAWVPSPDVSALLSDELLSIKRFAFWNTLRFLWAAARQREGAYPDNRSTAEKERHAIDYNQLLGKPPHGRPQRDVSAFSLMTTIYTDAITVSEVTGYSTKYLARDHRSLEDWRRFVSERNKAIRNVELLGKTSTEGQYRIQQALAVGPFTTQYAEPNGADLLPYSREEVANLVNALLFECNNQEDKWVADEALKIIHEAKLLQEGYRYYTGSELKVIPKAVDGLTRYVLEG